jgi:alkylation response protein AidB-like acyl-CoA dehydrogenase
MHFELDSDRRMLADTLTRFLAEQYPFGTRDAIAKSAHGYSPEMWAKLAELGAIGALFRESDGGYGGTAIDIAVVFEALGRGLVVEPFLASAVLAGGAIAAADGGKHAKLLADLIAGAKTAAFAHEEPDARYELAHVRTRAVASGGTWLLEGDKAVVLHGEHADCFVVSARTSGALDDEAGISLFLVPARERGLAFRGYPLVDGGRAAELTLRRVELARDALLGTQGHALPTIEKVVGAGVLALCAEALGAMEAAKASTLEYLRTRQQFGVPIGSFQALQHRMAEMLLQIEQARSAVINAIAAFDADRVKRERALSAAKYTIGRTGTPVAEESIQMHGGIGMSWELPLAHYAKRLVMIDHQLGDEDHHLQRYIELGRQGVAA